MVGRGIVAALLGALLVSACGDKEAGRVDPADHAAFYLWAGVRPGPEVARASELYILDGEVRRDRNELVALHPQAPRLADKRLWLVVRTQTLDWNPAVRGAILRDLERWATASPGLQGLQVDFDAATAHLDDYAAFLRELRAALPPRYRLSITGLMDWSANADPAMLATLKGTVDEVVVQSYQGRTAIPGYERYLERLARVPVAHKVALVEGGAWREPAALRSDPLFRGYVVFLLNPR